MPALPEKNVVEKYKASQRGWCWVWEGGVAGACPVNGGFTAAVGCMPALLRF